MVSLTLNAVQSAMREVAEMKKKLENETLLRKAAEAETNNLQNQVSHLESAEVCFVFHHILGTILYILAISSTFT